MERNEEIIKRFSPKNREIISMVLDGDDYKTVSIKVGVDVGTVRNTVYRYRHLCQNPFWVMPKDKKNKRIYKIWYKMKSRCENQNDIAYRKYGAKGISYCEEWKDYSQFKEWALNNGYEDDLTIDRIDSKQNYTPKNCRWVNYETQNNNRGDYNVRLSLRGETHTIAEWAKIANLTAHIIHMRLKKGMSVEEALTLPSTRTNLGGLGNDNITDKRTLPEVYISEHENGLLYKEIAKKYGVTTAAVTSAIYHYRHKLDGRLEDTDFSMSSEPLVKVKDWDGD